MDNHWKKFIPACMSGNIIELYQFIIYGYFAPIIGKAFFSSADRYTALLATFTVFATGSVVRPFSATLLGYLGDKLGRRIALITSISMMALSTLGIGLLPTYTDIGIAAPLMLLGFRVCQGLSMTGEEIGAALFLMENADQHEKGYASCFILGSVYVGLFLGAVVSALLFLFLCEPLLSAWGWRIPFLLGGIIGLITLIFRIRQPESHEFKAVLLRHKKSSNPFIDLLKSSKLSVLRITFLYALYAVAIYLFAVYIPNMLHSLAIAKYAIMLLCSIVFILTFFISLWIGKISDKIGSTIPLLISTIGFFIFAYPLFYLLSLQSLLAVIIAYGLFALLLGISAGSIMYPAISCFPVTTRFSGSCIAFNLSMSLFGGTAPLLALYLTNLTHHPVAPALLIMATAILTLIAIATENKPIEEMTNDHQISCQIG